MKIDLKKLLSGDEISVNIDCKLQFPNMMYSDYNAISGDVDVKGSVYSKADVLYFDAFVSFMFKGVCDRCVDDIHRSMAFDIKKILVEELQDDNETELYLLVKNSVLNLDEVIEEEMLLFFPSKLLCKEDCKGLCSKCGKNLNDGNCNCKADVDPRFEALLQLLDEE